MRIHNLTIMELADYISAYLPIKAKMDTHTCENVNETIIEGRRVCEECGLDLGSYLVCNTNGKITDRNKSNIERVGAPINPHLPTSSMGTSIRWSSNQDMMRIRKYQNWSVMPSKERSLYQVYTIIADHCNKPGVSISKKAQSTAKSLYQVISGKYTTRGVKRKGLIAACVYYACKIDETPKDPSVIADLFEIRNKDLSTGIRIFVSVSSGIDHPLFDKIDKTTVSEDYLGRYCTQLGIADRKVLGLANAICQKIRKIDGMDFYTPTTIAASVLYYILRSIPSPPTANNVSEAIGISPGTILRCYKHIVSKEDKILPPKILSAIGQKGKQ
jgi:transcription initiation factor TFIIB